MKILIKELSKSAGTKFFEVKVGGDVVTFVVLSSLKKVKPRRFTICYVYAHSGEWWEVNTVLSATFKSALVQHLRQTFPELTIVENL